MQGLEWAQAKEQRDFSLRFEMTAGYHQVLLPIGNTLRPNNLCRLALPPLSSRPTPAVIATCPRCHLDRRERSLQGRISAERQDFSLRFEMTAGEASRPSPYRELQYFSPAFKMTAGYHQVLLPIGNTLRPNNLCRLDLPPLSSRPQGEISNRAWNGLRQSKDKISRSASK